MKKTRTRLRGTKTAPKAEQKKLISRLKELRNNPALLLPKTRAGTKESEVSIFRIWYSKSCFSFS